MVSFSGGMASENMIKQMKAAAKEKMGIDQDMDFDEEFVVPTGKGEPEEVLMDNMEALDYADGRMPDDEDSESDEE